MTVEEFCERLLAPNEFLSVAAEPVVELIRLKGDC